MLSNADLEKIARAAGLWADSFNSKHSDPFGALVQVCVGTIGFVTYIHSTHLDSQRAPSEVLLSDAGVVLDSEAWTQIEGGDKLAAPPPAYMQSPFRAIGGSFALTGAWGIPDRVFLFPSAARFNLLHIANRLHKHLKANPPPMFEDGELKLEYPDLDDDRY
ncbi:MAG TPA: hypothetical protein VGP13_02195 [Candidatus Paceibacterota bacterium]|jgi:hypothetical protein|nr:hypothetical protein [Candidatus Paceibacterota bacterium]